MNTLFRLLITFMVWHCFQVLKNQELINVMFAVVLAITNPLEDVLDFIHTYDERYSPCHPVFYQGTYSQVLNDAKRELKFLLIYLHNEDAVDTSIFCRLLMNSRTPYLNTLTRLSF